MSTVYEEKSISKAILRVAIPAMIAQLATLIYNLADTYFVSITKSAAQISAVSLCTPVLLIIMSIACIFGMGGSSVIARLLGEGDEEKTKNCLNFCMYATIISGVIVLAIGLLFNKQIAVIIGANEENLGYTCDYLHWIFIGAPFIMIANAFAHICRSIGLIKVSTTGTILGNVINIVLDYVLIIALKLGTAGAAMATSIGFFVATIYYMISLLKLEKSGSKYVSLSPAEFHPQKAIVTQVVQIGIPGALITVLMSIGNIVLYNYIAIYGTDAVASYGIAYKIDMFPVMLSVGLSQGVAPLLGYYYGARQEKKLSKAMAIGSLYSIILGAVFLVVLYTCSVPFAKIFMHEDKLIALTAHTLRLLCLHAPIMGIINMITSYFQALGKALPSLVITLLRNAVLFIPGVIILNFLFKLNGVILTQFIVEVFLTVICLFMYFLISPKKVIR